MVNALEQEMMGFFGKHLVAYCLSFRQKQDSPTEPPRFVTCAGTIMSVGPQWVLVTAGHFIDEVLTGLDQEEIQILSCRLADTFGSERVTDHPIPFDLETAPHFSVYDREAGLDFALIYLRPHYRNLLEANGVAAIPEAQWAQERDGSFAGFTLLGLPTEFVTTMPAAGGNSDEVTGMLYATMIGLEQLDETPEDLPRTQHRQFVARVPEFSDLQSIVGMSGGPIFGFWRGEDKRLYYKIVAIQSRWFPNWRVTIGTPIRLVGEQARQLVG